MINDLHVDLVRCEIFLRRPALVDYIGKVQGDVQRILIIPAVLEPARELLGRILFYNIDIQFPLLR